MKKQRISASFAGLLSLMVVAGYSGSIANASPADTVDEAPPRKKQILPPEAAEPAPKPSPRQATADRIELPKLIARYFEDNVGRRFYIQVDKPLYKPGEAVWFRTWDLKARDLTGSPPGETTVELVSPKGAVVLKKRLKTLSGSSTNDFELPADVQGGEYTLRAIASDGEKAERTVIVSAYESPRIKKKLEFIKKAYGPGDPVSATVELKRPTGEALANKTLTAVVVVDGVELPRLKITSNAEGGALVKFELPKAIDAGDGLLTILVEDGGVTESISRTIPILQKKLSLAFFPEGGKMVAGLPTRLYFEAKTPLGKPADVDGRLIDDLGNAVATFATYKNGLGRIEFTPATGRRYHAEVTRPTNVAEKYALPIAEDKGCVLRSYDDFDGQENALRVGVRCSERRKVVVAATQRENLLDAGTIQADADAPGVIYLATIDKAIQRAAGVARITVFDQDMNPLAERLVFRNRRARLDVKVEADRKSYAPRDQVSLQITTRDAAGKPVSAELALSVVDDTVVAFADDKSGHLISKLLLEPELPGKVEEPNFYLDLTEAKSAMTLDMLMGARGYRRFDWVAVLRPPLPASAVAARAFGGMNPLNGMARMVGAPAPAPMQARVMPVASPPIEAKQEAMRRERDEPAMAERRVARADAIAAAPPPIGNRQQDAAPKNEVALDKDFARAAAKKAIAAEAPQALAAVRVFPIPAFHRDYRGPRNDYRETVFWTPSVKTDQNGKANVKFVLSDAVTSFRVSTEGVGGGSPGRDETVLKSSLPFSLDVKLPLEVSAGDRPLIPVTLTNESQIASDVKLDAAFGSLMKTSTDATRTSTLPAGQRKSLFIPLEVTGTRGQSTVRVAASAGGLNDEVVRSIPVVPVGFPQLFEKSGQIRGEASHDVDLGKATKGSVQATVKVYTSLLATTMSGLDGMLREPAGCFEQASSTNYPNVMIMQYLKQHEIADSMLLERSGRLLEAGYRRLSGYESPKKGYEWFGGDPGHEALTAYGLMQFADMRDVYGNVDAAMIARTAAWLKSRRDGNGGYLRDAKALDSFGRASPDVTDAYITWALVAAGETGLEQEIAKTTKLAENTQDPYLLALAAGTLVKRSAGTEAQKAGRAAVVKLVRMQAASGAWLNADHSITRSGGNNLKIETTSLAIVALIESGGNLDAARKGVEWLQANRSGFGQWGATQATVLALKALTAYDNATRVAPHAGAVSLVIDGVVVKEIAYDAGRREPILFTDFENRLSPGKHTITLRTKSGDPLPYSIAIEYRTAEPSPSANAVVELDASLAKGDLKMGETVRLNAVLRNNTQRGQPMTLARLGLPGGLTFQNWQLKELSEKGEIAFFETRAREVILYFRDLKPGEVKKIGIDLVASVPGSYTGPASSAYLYYDDTEKSWSVPMSVKIAP